jgi:hypothetical protein
MDFPSYRMPHNPVVTMWSMECLGQYADAVGVRGLQAHGSTIWPTANMAYFWPLCFWDWVTVYQFAFLVGNGTAGFVDIGIYDSQKNRVVSAGSTAMSGSTNALQVLNVTDTELPPGDYLLAMALSSTTGSVYGATSTDEFLLSSLPIYEQSGLTNATLTDPGVPVLSTSLTALAVASWGIQLRSSPAL